MASNFYININDKQQQQVRSAILHLIHEEFPKAWGIISQLIDSDDLGNDPDIRWLTAQYFFQQDASDQRAERECWDLLHNNENHPFALTLMGQIKMSQLDYEQAVYWFNRAIHVYPSESCDYLNDSVFALQQRPEQYLAHLVKCNLVEVTASPNDSIDQLMKDVKQFTIDRDWDQFHNGKDLAIALSLEASELLEPFLWKEADKVPVEKVKEELADIINYALLIADKYQLDPAEIVRTKILVNQEKYPVEKSRGSAKKYTEL